MSIASFCTLSISRELSLPPTMVFLVYREVHQMSWLGLRLDETLWYTAGLNTRMSPGRKAIARPRVGNVKYNATSSSNRGNLRGSVSKSVTTSHCLCDCWDTRLRQSRWTKRHDMICHAFPFQERFGKEKSSWPCWNHVWFRGTWKSSPTFHISSHIGIVRHVRVLLTP